MDLPSLHFIAAGSELLLFIGQLCLQPSGVEPGRHAACTAAADDVQQPPKQLRVRLAGLDDFVRFERFDVEQSHRGHRVEIRVLGFQFRHLEGFS